jgi:oxygen-independent coproporphyrinogen-3 oxidase
MQMGEETLKSKVLKLDRAVPRYTSYPAATVFESNFSPATYSDWLTALPDNSTLSLYVHIPFCPKLCHYCGCFTHITTRYAPVEDYVHLLRREIAAKGKLLGNKHRVTHLHFGGGSPTMLNDGDFTLLMDTLREFFTFTPDAEIAVEVDPRHMTEQLARTYKTCGVNRISFGVQDFDEKVMQAVGRVQPFDVVYKAAEYLRDAGIHDLNLDFIYGLPHQTIRSLTRSMDYALLLKPNRVALYGYAHVPWKKKNMRLIPDESLPDNDARYDLFNAGADVLEQAGFRSIGIDHFVKDTDDMAIAQHDGSLGRNFQGYTNIAPDALIGFGVSSISQLPQGFAQNTTAAHAYQEAVLHNEMPPIAKGYAFKGEDIARKEIIDGLMCNLSANINGIKQNDIKERLEPFIRDKLATLDDDGTLTINPKSRPVVRIIAAVFDEYLPAPDVTQRHSMAI